MHPRDRRERAWCGVQQSPRVTGTNPVCHPVLVILRFFRWASLHCFARLRPRFELISVKLLISLISRHAAKRLDLTGQAWASTETTALQDKLWIGNVPKPNAACWMESPWLHDDTRNSIARNPALPIDQPPLLYCTLIQTFTVLLRDVVICRSLDEQGYSFNFLAARCWWSFSAADLSHLLPRRCFGCFTSSVGCWFELQQRMNHIPYEA